MSNKFLKISLLTSERGTASLLALILITVMGVILADISRLGRMDDKNRQFLKQKSITCNDLISAANETRWEMYRYYATGQGDEDIRQAGSGKDVIRLTKIYRSHSYGTVKRSFYADKKYRGGYWYFLSCDENIMPSVKWYFKVEDHHIVESRWGP